MSVEKVFEGFLQSNHISGLQTFCKEAISFVEVLLMYCGNTESRIISLQENSQTTNVSIPAPFLIVEDNGVCFLQSNPIQSNPIQSNPIQSNPIQSNPIQSNQLFITFTQLVPEDTMRKFWYWYYHYVAVNNVHFLEHTVNRALALASRYYYLTTHSSLANP